MDRFASITAFVRVAESGGFSAAGRRLSLSKATISDQVQSLENALGVRLLNRTTRRVSLTEIGRSYYERCVQILHDLEEADEPPAPNRQPRAASFAFIANRASCSSSRRSWSTFSPGILKCRSICATVTR
jgi:DNA-binding transcriptional LysR family regulator